MVRKLAYALTRLSQMRSASARRTWPLTPAFKDPYCLGDAVNRLQWYLPRDHGIALEVLWHGNNKPSLEGLPVPRHQAQVDPHLDIRWIESLDDASPSLVWNADSGLAAELWRARGNLRILDPEFWSTAEASTHLRLAYHDVWTSADRTSLRTESAVRMNEMLSGLEGRDRVYLFGTGPSLTDVLGSTDFSDGIRLVCNSIVKSEPILRAIDPDIIVAADPVFHYGPSRYAAQFRADLIKALEVHDAWLAAPSEYCATLVSNFPEITPRLIALDRVYRKPFLVPTAESLLVKRTDNVLTGFMIPIALAMGSHLEFVGCDGREPGDNRFWKHNPTAQYGQLYESVVETHPSFFTDRNYEGYYKRHVRTMSEMLGWAESSLDVSVTCLTPSRIPALAKRS